MKKNGNDDQSKRELVKALYLRGSSHREISAATGLSVLAVQKRINRGKWRKLKDAVTNAVPVRSLTLKERSQVVRENLATDLQVSSERLADLKRSTDPAQEKERQAVVGQIVSSSKEVFSWDENPAQPPFDWFILDRTYSVDVAAGTKSNGTETKQLTPAEIEKYKNVTPGKYGLILDVEPARDER